MTRGRPSEKVLQAAASWRARMEEPASEQEVVRFESWLAADPAHARAYGEMDSVMRAAANVSIPAEQRASSGYSRVRRPAMAVALAALAMVTVVLLWQSTSTPAYASYRNSTSAVRGVRLVDGSVIWLDIDTEVGVRKTGDGREVLLRHGRVRIVPSGLADPFEVIAGTVRIGPARGPVDIALAAQVISVAALDHPVALHHASEGGERGLQVASGQAVALYGSGVRPIVADRSWPIARVRFVNAPLGRIINLANRQPGPDLVAGDHDIAALRVSGIFDLRDTRRLAAKLATALGLSVARQGSMLMLQR